MLVAGVVDHQLGNDAQTACMRFADELPGIAQGSIVWMNGAIFTDVVTVVEPRAGIERQQPNHVDTELHNVIQLLQQAGEVADPVVITVKETFEVQLINDGVAVPFRVRTTRGSDRNLGWPCAARPGLLIHQAASCGRARQMP